MIISVPLLTIPTRKNRGFTLVELLVVIFIIGVLASLLVSNFVGVRNRADDAKRKSDLDATRKALQLYYTDYQRYPASTDGTMYGCGIDGTSACSLGGSFAAGADSSVYMSQLPEDFEYYSTATDNYETFVLVTVLDNASDADIEKTQNKCNPAGRAYVPPLPDNSYVLCED